MPRVESLVKSFTLEIDRYNSTLTTQLLKTGLLGKSFIIVSFYTLLSRISGFARDIFVAKYMGTGPLAEAFFIALRLPNFFRRLFAEGALNAAFVPLFNDKSAKEGKESAIKFAENIYALLFVTLFIFSAVIIIFMPFFLYLIAPGFEARGDLLQTVITLTRLTFPYLMAVSIANLFGGILNSIGKFSAAAILAVFLNFSIMLFIVFLPQYFATVSHAAAWAVFTAGVFQVAWMYYFTIKEGFFIKLKLSSLKITSDVKLFLRKFMPGAIGAGITQINLFVDTLVASFITGAVAYLYYAERVSQFPLSLIATAMGTALLPALSRKLAQNDLEGANSNYNRAMEIISLLTIPATFALIILSYDITSVLFERGEFTHESTLPTALALAFTSIGLPAFSLNKVYSSCFFAIKDTRTPVVSSVMAMFMNIIFIGIFILIFRQLGFYLHLAMPLATSCAGIINATYLHKKLKKAGHFHFEKLFFVRLVKIIFASLLMSLVIGAMTYFLKVSKTNLLLEIMAGGGVFVAVILLTRAFDLSEIKKIIKRK